MKYRIGLHFPFDYNVESNFYSNDVSVIDGELGDMSVVIESALSPEQILRKCSVDIATIALVKD